jgi:phage tail-like protein
MAIPRDNPYGAFNFRLTVDRFGDAGSVQAGFQEISGLSMEVAVAEYRNGNEKENYVRKMYGMPKATDVTLKRGVIGEMAFFDWIKEIADGDQSARRQVTIELMDEAGQEPVMTWTLTNAWPMKYTPPTLNAKGGTDVAIEELQLACEKVEVE